MYIGQRWLYEELFLLDLPGIIQHLHTNNSSDCFSTTAEGTIDNSSTSKGADFCPSGLEQPQQQMQ